MLTEEALIILATIGASGLFVLGVVELVWPSTPRRPARRPRPAPLTAWQPPPARVVDPRFGGDVPPSGAQEEIAAVPEPVSPAVAIVPETPAPEPPAAPVAEVAPPEPPAPRRPATTPRAARTPRTVEWRRTAPVLATNTEASTESPTIDLPPVDPPAVPTLPDPPAPVLEPAPELAPAVEPVTAVLEPPPVVEVTPEPPAGDPSRPQLLPIDTCLVMYREHRYAEVVSLGGAALQVHARMAAVSDRRDEAAALQDLVGLSKQEMGDRGGARAAFAAAIAGAPATVRPTYVRHLLTLVRGVVENVNVKDDDGVRVRELLGCLATLDESLAAAPDDEALTAGVTSVRQALTKLCDRLAARAIEDEGDPEARDLVLQVLADGSMPAAWQEKLRERLASASSAEIGQLTAQAIRAVQEGKDSEALDALERAERLAVSLPGGSVADDRREELERRLWWGYTKVGLRRVETKKFEGALEPLFRALTLAGIDVERIDETRGALVRALDGLVDARWTEIQKRGAEDPRAAQAEAEKLWAVLRNATERGVTQDQLGDAFSKVMHLTQTLTAGR